MRRPGHPVTGVITILVLAFMYLPIVFLFINAFNADRNLVQWGGLTTEWFERVFQDDRIRKDFVASVEIAAFTTAISVVIAVSGALWARRAGRRGQMLFEATTFMRIILPEVVIAVGLFVLFRRLEIPLGTSAVVIGHVVFLSAYATVIVQARMATMGSELELAASDLGATPWRGFRRVTLPQLLPAVAVAGLLVFTFSFDDVITSQFLAGGKVETLPVLLLGLIRHEITPEVNAVGALVILLTLSTFAAAVAIAGLRAAAGFGQSSGDRGDDE